MKTKIDQSAGTIEEARRELSHRLAEVIQDGEIGMQVRFVQTGETSQAWVYTRKEHEWRKRDDRGLSPRLIGPLRELLEGLFTQKYADAWTCHRTDHSDRTDFELKFCRESIEPHVKGDLESYLLGCVSHGHHDSGMDSRRRMGFKNS